MFRKIYLLFLITMSRSAFTNIRNMLKPGGQCFFNTFPKTFFDEVYKELDKGKWSKYNNQTSMSAFHNSINPKEDYEHLIEDLGFIDCQFFLGENRVRYSEKSFQEFIISINGRLASVEDEDKEAYLQDYIQKSKKTTFVDFVGVDPIGEKIYEMRYDVITGVITKPL